MPQFPFNVNYNLLRPANVFISISQYVEREGRDTRKKKKNGKNKQSSCHFILRVVDLLTPAEMTASQQMIELLCISCFSWLSMHHTIPGVCNAIRCFHAPQVRCIWKYRICTFNDSVSSCSANLSAREGTAGQWHC